MKEPIPFIEELQSTADRNVFVMMRYSDSPQFAGIEQSLRGALLEFGLIARLAKDRAISDDLWENIRIYMANARFGIAVLKKSTAAISTQTFLWSLDICTRSAVAAFC